MIFKCFFCFFAENPDLGEVSILGSFNCILGNVVPEDHARVGAIHHPHPLLLHSLHITLAFQLPSQTLPVAAITHTHTQKCLVRETRERSKPNTPFPPLSFFLSSPLYHRPSPPSQIRSRQPLHPLLFALHASYVSLSSFPTDILHVFSPLFKCLFALKKISHIACDPAAPLFRLLGSQLLLADLHQVFQLSESVQLPCYCGPVWDHLEERLVALGHGEQHGQLPVTTADRNQNTYNLCWHVGDCWQSRQARLEPLLATLWGVWGNMMNWAKTWLS